MAAAVDMPSPAISPRDLELDTAEDPEGNLFTPGHDIEVDASPLTSKVFIYIYIYIYSHS